MSVSRVKTWIAGEVLTASDLNSEFNNILNNGEDLGWPATKAKDLNGQSLILDADADTSITADTDDQIDIAIAGADDFRITANTFTALSGSTIATNTIAETTADSGVTVDGVLIKDGSVTITDDIIHSGDINNLISFDTDTQDFQTGGSSRLDISDSGVRLGGANTRVTTILDEDTMSSDSATALATQQSIKAYVDASSAVQVVSTQTGAVATGTTSIPNDDTIPQNTEGDEYMTLAVTPTNASNILQIDVVVNLSSTNTSALLIAALFQDTTADALAAGFGGRTSATTAPTQVVFRHRMTAGTTSATTFKVRAGAIGAGTTTFNGQSGARLFGGVMASSITITEIKA